jgi:hypothetical protein
MELLFALRNGVVDVNETMAADSECSRFTTLKDDYFKNFWRMLNRTTLGRS